MAQRRMFSLQVVDTDRFLDMTPTARLLYYELGMRADDDGFVASARRIVRTVGCSNDDLQELLDNGYLIRFDSGVLVIRHWKINNRLQGDRHHATVYQEEYSQLVLEHSRYELDEEVNPITGCAV